MFVSRLALTILSVTELVFQAGNTMALKATIFKAQLNVADMDRHHYQDYNRPVGGIGSAPSDRPIRH